ncbi:UDP-N-acetylglucosamine 2-epimerase [Thermoanaerobacterium sp. DL9XJH110]|uniref:UDP-N-acetylglucosamine 2-epimerase n=1 Tax=Thermoanaerobacterium sp. DL9XJH110 TaxID=3386643 RepID=UPI003BB56B4D
MKKIMVFTSTRADYGLLKPLLKRIKESPHLNLLLVVAGDHLLKEKGYTVSEITDDGFTITEKITHILMEDTREALSKSVGIAILELSSIFEREKPDMLILLGDRYELLAPATCAVIQRVPIVHICGGESTEGAIDEQIRHALTKMAHLHFPSTMEYGWAIRQMGEEAWRIHVTGSLSVENIRNSSYMTPLQLKLALGIDLNKPILLITYHPESLLSEKDPASQIEILINALKYFSDYQQVITFPGVEAGYKDIIYAWKQYAQNHSNVFLFESLGSKAYLGLMKICRAVVGNSSSGLIEAPSFCVPTLNIGERQKGRIRASSVIDVKLDVDEIIKGLNKILFDKEFIEKLPFTVNPYDPFKDGNASKRIVKILEETVLDKKLLEKRLDFPEPKEREAFNVQ